MTTDSKGNKVIVCDNGTGVGLDTYLAGEMVGRDQPNHSASVASVLTWPFPLPIPPSLSL